jgi:pimeloyl-ACP methyl ester carboxylesterase
MSEILLQAAAQRGVPVPPPPHDAAALGELAGTIFLHPMRGGRRVAREEAYLAGAVRQEIETTHGRLAAWMWGGEISATPLVALVHGWEGHGAQLGAFATPLVAAGFRVLTFDAPGHGESPGREAHVPLLARVLPEVQARTGPFFAVIGHSMGAAAAAMSTMLGVAPRGMVLLAPPLSAEERVDRVAARMQLAPAVREAFAEAVQRRTGARFADVDLRMVARRAPCPLVVFHDPADTDTSFATSEEIVALWRGARLVPCPGRGHYRLLVTQEVVRQTVEFLVGLRENAPQSGSLQKA